MKSYAFWNNKGGVGKSFLSFVAATEYARTHPDTDVYVIDLCPQANISEMLLLNAGMLTTSEEMPLLPPKMVSKLVYENYDVIHQLIEKTPRATIAGYLEARLNSPFQPIDDVSPYVCFPKQFNRQLPDNLQLVCGDYLLEILSEAIRQTSQLSIPTDAWKQVLDWIKDLTIALRQRSGNRETFFIIDCNPSFAIYTQLALAAAENMVVPFTPDDSSRRALENVVALLYGYGIEDDRIKTYAKINFTDRARAADLDIPKFHTFISNRVTLYRGSASRAFQVVSESIKNTVDDLHNDYSQIYANPDALPSKSFIEVPDYHSACIVMTVKGIPLNRLQPGSNWIGETDIKLSREPLERYRQALTQFVDRL